MPKQLNVSLAFTADTAQAKRQIQELEQSLAKLSSDTIKNNIGSKMTEDLHKSVAAASQLRDMLQQAVNPKTGNLDLSRFSEQLKASGRDIQSYAQDLNNLGPQGTKAFMQLAQSVASAEVPMRRTNALVKEFGVTLMNAARWQFSSSVLHGFMGAIQGAYNYAQNLDESLTNIAIVTGRSRDEMAQFAEQANKSAQALSASTTEYTDAALIYYQQGLGDADVQARTDATIKLANVTGQSAEQISSYMTAIWNNFEDGSHTMEYYADVITSLGAHTASSSEEIARGMQQFASVAKTVGLSYEYAASALATIVAQTRQSETSVGNGLRTIFARFDSLKMGETIEDGVDLTKYTEALQKAGVSVLDQNGELKDMNTILDEIGERWQTLNETQKTTLANTVGGVRQYSNLMALFDNWDEFQKNVGIAGDAEGSLDRQAQIYAESWEAAQKRVKAAWQAIYQDLIDSNFFIDLLNTVEKVLKGIDSLIDGLGGLKGVFGVLGAVITTVFADNLAKGIQNAVYNFKVFTGQAQQDADALAVQFKNVADQMGQDLQSPTATAEVGVLKDQIDFALKLRQASDSITGANKQQLLSLNEITKEYANAYVEAVKLKETAENTQGDMATKLRLKVGSRGETPEEVKQNRDIFTENITSTSNESSLQSQVNAFKEAEQEFNNIRDSINSVKDDLNTSSEDFANWGDKIQNILGTEITTRLGETAEESEKLANTLDNNTKILQSSLATVEDKQNALKEISNILNEAGNHEQRFGEFVQDTVEQIASKNEVLKQDKEELIELGLQMGTVVDATQNADNAQANYNERLKQAQIEFENLKGKVDDYSTKIVTCARGMSQLWAAFNSFGRILDTLNKKDLTWADKLKAIIPSLLTGLPMLISGLQTLSKGKVFASIGEGITVGMAAFKGGSGMMAAFGAGISKVIGLLGPFAIKIGIVVGAVWLLVKAFQAWKASTPEGQLEAANKRLEEASQKAQEATDAYNELKSTLDEYKQTKEDLNNVEDSSERARMINEENDKILELINSTEKWQKIIPEIKYDDNGLISLTEEQIKALENDKAREESLARQLELQEKINVNTANQKVEDSEYTGKKIQTKVETLGGADGNIKQYQKQDVTGDIAELLAVNGLNAKSDDSKIREALIESGKYDESQLDGIIEDLHAIANDQASLKQFEEMAANHLQTIAMNDALEKQQQQEQIGRVQTEMGDKLSLDSLSRFDEVQAKIAEVWETLTEQEKEQILNSANANEELQRVLGDRLNIEEANNEALKHEEEEREKWRTQNINSMADKMSGVQLTGKQQAMYGAMGEDAKDTYLKTELSKLSDEDLKIAATLELDKYKSIEELKKAIEDIKQQTEQDRLFAIEMKNAEDHGLDMTEWQEYVDYLQESNAELKNNKVLAGETATANMRLNRGVEDLSKNYKNSKEVIEEANKAGNKWAKGNIEYAKSIRSMQESLADISNLDFESIQALGDDFILENMELIGRAAEGDVDAIDSLIKEIAEAQLMKLEVPAGIDKEEFNSDRQDLINAIDETNLNTIEIGSKLDAQPFYDELLKMVTNGEIGAADINTALASIGYSPIVEWKTINADNFDEVVGSAQGEMQFQDLEGNTHTAKDSVEMKNYVKEHGEIKIPVIKGSNGGNGQPQIATAANLSKALGNVRFTGGTGNQTNPSNRNTGNNKSSCFAAGTLVSLNNTYKNIENIEVGDIVLSYNEQKKKNVFSKVVQTMIHFVRDKIYDLFVKNEKLTVTGNHKFLIIRENKQEWIQVEDIRPGDLVLLADGSLQEVFKIEVEEKPLTVYNFEVSNTHNYYVGKNQILAHNKGGGGKNKGKGSGSGKDRDKKEKKELETAKKEEDRYHNLKETIEDVNQALDALGESKDRAFGKDKLNMMKLEITKFKEQIKLTKDYIKKAKEYQAIDKENLKNKLKEIGMSKKQIDAQFDKSSGVLVDYEKLFETIQDNFNKTALKALNNAREEYNKKVDAWNSGKLNEDQWKAAEEKLKIAEEHYKKEEELYKERIDALKTYEETTNTIQEKEKQFVEQSNELLDKILEVSRQKLELKISVNDDEKSKLEWLFDNLGDDADRAADKIANLGQQANTAQKKIGNYLESLRTKLHDYKDWSWTDESGKEHLLGDQEGLIWDFDITDPASMKTAFDSINGFIKGITEATLAGETIFSELPVEQIIDDLSEIRDGLLDEYKAYKEIADTVEETLVDAYDKWNEKIDENLDLFDHYDTVIETYKEIADLLGSDALGFDPDLDMSYQRAKLSNQQQAAKLAKDAYDEAINERIKAQERLANATSDIEKKAAEEYLKRCEEVERERQEEFLTRTRDALRLAQELFEQTIEQNLKVYTKSLGGGTPSLGVLQDQLDMNKELNDLYLDDYEKYKKLGDLQNNINKQLAKNPNVKVQGKLKDLLDDVNSKMAAGAEISEGEATILEKRLALLQAEDQLMAARNAKSAVRMTRDNEGNFSYTYTADTSKIEEAQQNYADKFYDLLDYEKQYSQEVQDNILQAMQDFNDKAEAILTDDTLSEAEKKYLLQQLEDQCKTKVKFYTDQMQIVTDEMTRFKNDDLADIEQILGRVLASDSDFETDFNETTLGKIAPAWNNAKDAMTDFAIAADSFVDSSIGAMNRLLADNRKTMEDVDSSIESFAENYTGLLQDVVDQSVNTAEAGAEVIATMTNSLDETLNETKKFYEEYGKLLQDLFNQINEITNAIDTFKANWTGEETFGVAVTDTGREGANPSTVSMSNPSEGVNNPTDRFTTTTVGSIPTAAISTVPVTQFTKDAYEDYQQALSSYLSSKSAIAYDSLLSMNKSQTVAGNNNVVINADFPNVESYEEIARAFETLINSASQYANENNG